MKLRGVRRGLSKGQMQLDRHSRMAKGSGAPKKGGLGGKFTWGDPLTNMVTKRSSGEAQSHVIDPRQTHSACLAKRRTIILRR